MKKRKLFLLVLVFLILVLGVGVAYAETAPWPMFQHDAQHTGRADYEVSGNLEEKWTFSLKDYNSSINYYTSYQPIIGKKAIYITLRNNKQKKGEVYAIDFNGTLIWDYEINNEYPYNPSIDSNENIYIPCSNGSVYALNSDGEKIWKFNTGREEGIISITIGNNNLYFTDYKYIYSVDFNGNLKWSNTGVTRGGSANEGPAIGKDGTIYVSWTGFKNFQDARTGALYAYNPEDGSERWHTYLNHDATAPAVEADGDIYLVAGSRWAGHEFRTLRAYNSSGDELWRNNKVMDGSIKMPVLSSDGKIIITDSWGEFRGWSWGTKIYQPVSKMRIYNPDGSIFWQSETQNSTRYNGEIILDNKNKIFSLRNIYDKSWKYYYSGRRLEIFRQDHSSFKNNVTGAFQYSPSIGKYGDVYFVTKQETEDNKYELKLNCFWDGSNQEPSCSDGIENGDETDIDCGGSCSKCANEKSCLSNSDCESGLCYKGVCSAINHDIEISIPYYAPYLQEAHKGTILTYIIEVKNKGNIQDTINLYVSSKENWDAELSQGTVTLAPKESTLVYLSVLVEGNTEKTKIIAESQNSDSKSSYSIKTWGFTDNGFFGVRMYFKNTDSEEHEFFMWAPNYVKTSSDFVELAPSEDKQINLIFDPKTSEQNIREFNISIGDFPFGKDITLPIKFDYDNLIATDFDIAEDSYNFPNWPPIDISGFGHEIELMGYCYGMSRTSILYFRDDIVLPKDNTYELTKQEAEENIKKYHWTESLFSLTGRLLGSFSFWKINQQEEYDKLKSNLENNNPMILNMQFIWSAKLHSVVAYKIVEKDNKSYIFIYDNDLPYDSSLNTFNGLYYITYNKETHKFTYGGDPIEVLVSDAKKEDDWIGYNAFTSPWLRLSIHSPVDINITDNENRQINNKGITQIPNAFFVEENGKKAFYLPLNLTYLVELDAYDLGNFTLETISPVKNESITITFFKEIPVNNNTNANLSINYGKTDKLIKIDFDGDGKFEKNKAADISEIYKTNISYKGNLTAEYSDIINLKAKLKMLNSSSIPNKTIIFNLGEQQIGVVTNKKGIASANLELEQNSGNYTLDVVFPGNKNYLNSFDSNSFEILKKSSSVNLTLLRGWNLISIPLELENNSVENVFGDIMQDVIVISGFDNGAKTYDPELPQFSDLQKLKPKFGYWIKMNNSRNLSVSGFVPENKTLNLDKGWNLVSYLCEQDKDVTDIFSNIMDKIIVINGFDNGAKTYDPKIPQFSDLQKLKTKFGYWIKMNKSVILDYNGIC